MKKKVFAAVAGVVLVALVVLTVVLTGKVQKLSKEVSQKDTGNQDIQELMDDMNDLEDRLVATTKDLEDAKAKAEKASQEVKDIEDLLGEYLGIDMDDSEGIDWGGLLGGLFGVSHEIWDNTAVVEAYRTGDASKLTDEKDIFVLEEVTRYIDALITNDMTDYEKEKAIYDWLVGFTAYDEGNLSAIISGEAYSHMPYGVLKYRTAICTGNATTFKLFMDCIGIECKIIHSVISGEHAWNMVKLGDDWYHVDVTFDGGASSANYTYFNVPDEVIETNGYPWNRQEFPEANSYEYCYVVTNAVPCDDVYELPKMISEAIAELPMGGMLSYRIAEEDLEAAYLIYEEISLRVSNDAVWLEMEPGMEVDGEYYVQLTYHVWEDTGEILDPDNWGDIDMDRIYEEIDKYFKESFYEEVWDENVWYDEEIIW